MINPQFKQVAEVIVQYSTAIQAGETVLIRGLTALAEPLMQALYQEVLAVGALPFTYVHMSGEDVLASEATNDLELLSAPNPMLTQMYSQADVVIGIQSADNLRALSQYPTAKQTARAQANFAPIKIQKERVARGEMRRCTTIFPTQAYAQASGMSLVQYTNFWLNACKINAPQPVVAWQRLRAEQEIYVQFFADKKHLRIQGETIDLTFSIEGRRFINSAGTANFPDGEVFTSPVEDSVNGWVHFTYPAYYNDVEVQGIELHFDNGQVTQATAQTNEAFLRELIATDDGAKRVGEFAIGTNTDISQFTGVILFDEKIAGTIHLALGQAFTAAGGQNQSNIHWDMVYDMRKGGEIYADDVLCYKNGEFVIQA